MPASTSHRRERVASLILPGTVWIGTKPVEPVRRLGTGVAALDAVLDGGVPRGRLSEIAGAPSSGRTALMCALLAAATRGGEVTAVVDLPDALHPESLCAAGVDLGRVLWVRPPSVRVGLRCAELVLAAGGFGLVVLDLGVPGVLRLPMHVWPRLARAAGQAGGALVVLAPQRVVGSFAAVSVTLTRQPPRWSRGTWRMFEGLAARAVVERNRHGAAGRDAKIAMSAER